jgi:hypothetical protein
MPLVLTIHGMNLGILTLKPHANGDSIARLKLEEVSVNRRVCLFINLFPSKG